jgi:hypothetical protein
LALFRADTGVLTAIGLGSATRCKERRANPGQAAHSLCRSAAANSLDHAAIRSLNRLSK